jgi:hypothetical protein
MLQTTSENSFGSKVHPAARSSILGHRVSGNAIRSGGMPALVKAATSVSRGQERLFPQRAAATTVEKPFLNISPSEPL